MIQARVVPKFFARVAHGAVSQVVIRQAGSQQLDIVSNLFVCELVNFALFSSRRFVTTEPGSGSVDTETEAADQVRIKGDQISILDYPAAALLIPRVASRS
ncbi:hypothetical protein D9M71_818610 [compost metagenome]